MRANRLKETNFLFPSKSKDQPYKDLKAFWRSVIKAADLPGFRIQSNRHTHASHLVSSGLSLPIVCRLLGYTNPSATQRYVHLADDSLRKAAEVMGKKNLGQTE